MKPRSELLPAIALVGILALAALIIVGPIWPSAPPVQPGSIDIQGGDYQSLSYAVSRLFGARVLPGGGKGRSEMRVGALPPGLPFELPVPPGTTVVGSVAGELPGDAQIAMDSSLAPDTLYQIYQASFTGQGFIEQAQEPGGFFTPDAQGAPSHNAAYCRPRDSVMIDLHISQQPGDPSAIWMYANWNAASVSCLATRPASASAAGADLLPRLDTPPGTTVQGYGSGGGGVVANAYQQAGVTYSGTAKELAEYLMPQLEKAGWELTGSDSSQYGAWSIWLVRDAEGHPWSGALIIVTSPASDRSSVRLEVTWQ